MKQATNHIFPVQVWLQTNAMATVLLLLGMFIADGGGVDMREFFMSIPMVLYVFCLSLLLSLPALGIFWLLFLYIKNLGIDVRAKKTILAVAGMLLVVLSFYTITAVIFDDGAWVPALLPCSYAAALALNTGLVRMYKTTRSLPAPEPVDKLQ